MRLDLKFTGFSGPRTSPPRHPALISFAPSKKLQEKRRAHKSTNMPSRTEVVQQEAVEAGQFDDAPEDGSVPPPADPRQGHNFIDDEALLAWSSESSEEESEPDEFEEEQDTLEAEAFQTLRAEDEDWEIAERGTFTSQSAVPHGTNRPRRFYQAVQPATTACSGPNGVRARCGIGS